MGFNSNAVFTIFIIAIFTFGMFSFVMNNISTNGGTISPEYQNVFNQYSEANNLYLTQQDIINGGEINPEGSDLAVTKDAIVSFKSIQDVGVLMVNMVKAMGQTLGVPAYVLTIIISMILFASFVGVIYALTQRKP